MTRTALKRNGFSRIPLSSIRQGAKAPFKTKEQRTWIETTKDAKEKAKNCKENMNVEKVMLYRIDKTLEF